MGAAAEAVDANLLYDGGGLGRGLAVMVTWSSVAVLAAGVASVSPVPAPLVLALVAVAAELSGHRRLRPLAWTWAAAAGLAPVLGAATVQIIGVGDGTMTDLGLADTLTSSVRVTSKEER